jgi:hypothetical protein
MRCGSPLILTILCASFGAAGQTNEGFLDIYTVRVKPAKRAEFQAAVKKMVDANRRHQGDHWLTTEVMYGDGQTVYFNSLRADYAEMEAGFSRFMGALNKTFGGPGTAKLMQDLDNCISEGGGELRRRRPDLSANPPRDAAGLAKLVGESRFVRTAVVRVRPGRGPDYENHLRAVKAAFERSYPQATLLVSEAVAGARDAVYYIASLQSSLAAFDKLPSSRSWARITPASCAGLRRWFRERRS